MTLIQLDANGERGVNELLNHLVSLADGEGGVKEFDALLFLTVKLQEDLKPIKWVCVHLKS